EHDNAIETVGEPAMRRSAVSECREQKSKAAFGVLARNTKALKDPLLHLGVVDPDAPRAQLRPVEHQVVRPRPYFERLLVQESDVLGPGRREGMMGGRDLPRFLASLEERKLGHPDEFEDAFLDQPQHSRRRLANGTERCGPDLDP